MFIMNHASTAVYSGVLNHKGECIFGLGDMDIHLDGLDAELITSKCGHVIRDAGIVIMDGNLSVCSNHGTC